MNSLVQTFVEKTRINYHQMLLFILCFVAELSNKQTGIEVNASKETVVEWLGCCRKICEIIMSQQLKIGGILYDEDGQQFSDIVEMDETHIVRRKYARGRLLKTEDIWVIGGISRMTKQCFAIRVPNRRIEVIDWVVETFVEPGSIIHTDQARVYQNLKRRFHDLYEVHRVNHKENFVHPEDPEVHTQTIESMWSKLKLKIKSFRNNTFIDTYVAKFLYFKTHLKPLEEKYSYGLRYKKFIEDLVKVYPGPAGTPLRFESPFIDEDDGEYDRIVDEIVDDNE